MITEVKNYCLSQIQKYNFLPNKKLGQNFLVDENVVDKIVRYLGPVSDNCLIMEVGSGLGSLTKKLLLAGHKVLAVEKDNRFLKVLQDLSTEHNGNLNFYIKDALEFSNQDLNNERLSNNKKLSVKIVSNLPYNVGTELLINWLHNFEDIDSYLLMFQKEVALRIVAKNKDKDYSRLSILSQYLCDCDYLFDVSPKSFIPEPQIYSSVVKLRPKKLTAEEKNLLPILENITKACFGQRRKMLRVSLKQIFSEAQIQNLCKNLNIEETIRPEVLPIDMFIKMAIMAKEF